MGNTMPATVAGFGDLLGRVDDGLREVQRLVRRIFADCERLLPWLGPLAKVVRQLLERLAQLVKRVFDEVGRLLGTPGDPIALWQTGSRWNNEVALHVGNPVGTLTADFMHGDDGWQGPAATAYRNVLPPQKQALQQVQTIAHQLGDSLHDVALRIAAFWVGLAVAAASFAAEMLAAAALSTGVATIPAGLTAAAAASSKFLAIMSGLILALSNLLISIVQAQARFGRQLADNAAFPGPPTGHWPVAVTSALNDGSMSDGDGSDWRLQP
jgi:hypothetical protein